MKMFFIIGMRRSGTSILRNLIMEHPRVAAIEFEPHPLWYAVDMNHFRRFKRDPYVQRKLSEFTKNCCGPNWYGAKFALNPGVKALEWVWLPQTFPECRIIFIIRDMRDTFESYYKEDRGSVRGALPLKLYKPYFEYHVSQFHKYATKNNSNAICVYFKRLVKDADLELQPAWELLGLEPLRGLNQRMKKPRHWNIENAVT